LDNRRDLPLILIAGLAALGVVATVLAGLPLFDFMGFGSVWISLAGAVLALAAGGILLRGALRAERESRARQALSQAFATDSVARLVTRHGEEAFRNGAARRWFGPVADPAAVLVDLVAGDERTIADLGRLRDAAQAGRARRADVALTLPQGEREWLQVAVSPLAHQGTVWTAQDVTARRALEESQRREYEMLADFIDFLPVGIYSADTDGTIRFVNQRLAEWLGRSATGLVGSNIADILGFLPNPEEERRREVEIRGRNDESFSAMLFHAVFDDGGLICTRSVVMRDLTPEKQWEKALGAAERRFRWLFDDAPVGIALVECEPEGQSHHEGVGGGIISACNLALQLMLGLDGDDLVGRPVADYIAEDFRADAVEQLTRVAMGSSLGTHLEVQLRGKRNRVVSLFVSPTHEDNRITGLVVHFIDTTEQKNLEIQFAQSQKMQAMGQLAGGVAHDFNNLLTAMIGFCDLLLQRHGAGDPSFADIMQIRQNANRAASLVRQLLAFSRKQALQPRLLDVSDALADLSVLLRRLLGETTKLKMVHGRDLGLVRVDPGQFDQVIINLAVNARDAMKAGGTLTIRTAAAHVDRPIQRADETMPAGDYVMIEVADSGTGIAPEDLGRIFEPFFSTKAVGEGTGLGLSTVYGIVRQTDGFVFVSSEPGKGTCFSIYLPRQENLTAQPLPARGSGLGAETAGAGDLTGKGTILFVEDEDAVRLFGSRALRNKGYQVLEARSGEGAMEIVRANEAFDVLISDVVMPGMDGVALAKLVRQERPQVKVILMSGYSEDMARGALEDQKDLHFLPKPFSLKQLAGAVKDVLTGDA